MASLCADTAGERRAYRVSVGAACLIHLGSALLLSTHPPPPRAAAMSATQVELTLPPPPPPPPPPAAEPPPEPRPEAAARPKAAARAKPTPAPEQPAAPPPLLTAAEDPQDTAPVRFASDPNGRSYSSGLVATSARPTPPPAAAQPKSASDGITPADQLERQATWRGDDCRGYFPDRAHSDLGRVTLIAVVRPDGSIAKLDVASETPQGQGFANAARACIQHQRFAPALDKKGRPTTARTQIGLRFSR